MVNFVRLVFSAFMASVFAFGGTSLLAVLFNTVQHTAWFVQSSDVVYGLLSRVIAYYPSVFGPVLGFLPNLFGYAYVGCAAIAGSLMATDPTGWFSAARSRVASLGVYVSGIGLGIARGLGTTFRKSVSGVGSSARRVYLWAWATINAKELAIMVSVSAAVVFFLQRRFATKGAFESKVREQGFIGLLGAAFKIGGLAAAVADVGVLMAPRQTHTFSILVDLCSAVASAFGSKRVTTRALSQNNADRTGLGGVRTPVPQTSQEAADMVMPDTFSGIEFEDEELEMYDRFGMLIAKARATLAKGAWRLAACATGTLLGLLVYIYVYQPSYMPTFLRWAKEEKAQLEGRKRKGVGKARQNARHKWGSVKRIGVRKNNFIISDPEKVVDILRLDESTGDFLPFKVAVRKGFGDTDPKKNLGPGVWMLKRGERGEEATIVCVGGKAFDTWDHLDEDYADSDDQRDDNRDKRRVKDFDEDDNGFVSEKREVKHEARIPVNPNTPVDRVLPGLVRFVSAKPDVDLKNVKSLHVSWGVLLPNMVLVNRHALGDIHWMVDYSGHVFEIKEKRIAKTHLAHSDLVAIKKPDGAGTLLKKNFALPEMNSTVTLISMDGSVNCSGVILDQKPVEVSAVSKGLALCHTMSTTEGDCGCVLVNCNGQIVGVHFAAGKPKEYNLAAPVDSALLSLFDTNLKSTDSFF